MNRALLPAIPSSVGSMFTWAGMTGLNKTQLKCAAIDFVTMNGPKCSSFRVDRPQTVHFFSNAFFFMFGILSSSDIERFANQIYKLKFETFGNLKYNLIARFLFLFLLSPCGKKSKWRHLFFTRTLSTSLAQMHMAILLEIYLPIQNLVEIE